MSILDQDIQYLSGVGPSRKKVLSDELGISTYGDLLQYYPYKYVDRSKVYTIHELTGDMPFIQVVGHILSFEPNKPIRLVRNMWSLADLRYSITAST